MYEPSIYDGGSTRSVLSIGPGHTRSQPVGGRMMQEAAQAQPQARHSRANYVDGAQSPSQIPMTMHRRDALTPHQAQQHLSQLALTPTTAEGAPHRQRPRLYAQTPPSTPPETPPETPFSTPPASTRATPRSAPPRGPAPAHYDAFGGARTPQAQHAHHQTYHDGRQQHGWSATRGRYVLPAQEQQAAQAQRQLIATAQHAHGERRPGYDHGIQQPPGQPNFSMQPQFQPQPQPQPQRPSAPVHDGMQQRAALRSQPVGGRLAYGAGMGGQLEEQLRGQQLTHSGVAPGPRKEESSQRQQQQQQQQSWPLPPPPQQQQHPASPFNTRVLPQVPLRDPDSSRTLLTPSSHTPSHENGSHMPRSHVLSPSSGSLGRHSSTPRHAVPGLATASDIDGPVARAARLPTCAATCAATCGARRRRPSRGRPQGSQPAHTDRWTAACRA